MRGVVKGWVLDYLEEVEIEPLHPSSYLGFEGAAFRCIVYFSANTALLLNVTSLISFFETITLGDFDKFDSGPYGINFLWIP
nr:hypothetical transcript [Hymenolepis microstoma]